MIRETIKYKEIWHGTLGLRRIPQEGQSWKETPSPVLVSDLGEAPLLDRPEIKLVSQT